MPSQIEWTDETWNFLVGCSPVSAGCQNCYAHRLESTRLRHLNRCPKGGSTQAQSIKATRSWSSRYTGDGHVACSLVHSSDLFHPDVPDDLINRAFQIMLLSRQHEFMVLTKRPERMVKFSRGLESLYKFHDDGSWNIWFGVSIEDQTSADERVPILLECLPNWFVSCEPLIEAIDLRWWPKELGWVIVGGESGPAARPMHPYWARSIRDQCADANVPFFFKQWGEYAPGELVDQETRYRFHERYAYGATQCKPNLIRYAGSDGTFTPAGDGCPDFDSIVMYRVGKKRAGHILDEREFLEFPKHRLATTGVKEL